MTNKNTIKVKAEVVLQNPEDYFNDLVDDGFSVREALLIIMEEELVHAKVHNMYPEMSVGEMYNLGGGKYKVVLERLPDMMEELI